MATLRGIFNHDGRTDYLVRVTTGRTTRNKRLYLIGFINQKGDYTPDPFLDRAYSQDELRSASAVIRKGTIVSLGLGEEGQGPFVELKSDAVMQYICETDASTTYAYANGEFKDIQKAAGAYNEVLPGPLPQVPDSAVHPDPHDQPEYPDHSASDRQSAGSDAAGLTYNYDTAKYCRDIHDIQSGRQGRRIDRDGFVRDRGADI